MEAWLEGIKGSILNIVLIIVIGVFLVFIIKDIYNFIKGSGGSVAGLILKGVAVIAIIGLLIFIGNINNSATKDSIENVVETVVDHGVDILGGSGGGATEPSGGGAAGSP